MKGNSMLTAMDSFLNTAYANPEQTKRDVLKTLERYKALIWKSGPFVFNNGACRELLSLEGTIPINYKGNFYNIPICIWLMDTHPNNAPLCFVRPTADMHIKTSIYVDLSGKIYLPYLHDWNPKNSDLLGLIQIMIISFSEFPPVYSRGRQEPQVTTPYPTMPTSYMPMPRPMGSNFTPYPPYPSTQHAPSTTATPYPPTPNFHNTMFESFPTDSSGIQDEQIKASLLSAIQDKVRIKLEEQLGQAKAELEILQQTSAELEQGKTKIQDIMDKMEKEKGDLERIMTVLNDKEAELIKVKTDLEEKKDVDVDDAVITTAPLYRQILNAYAEEASMEDALYYLGEALRRGVIDLDVFLKHVRSLSRKQFVLRALMQKCRQKAGLAC